jgi:hypothetical protein
LQRASSSPALTVAPVTNSKSRTVRGWG